MKAAHLLDTSAVLAHLLQEKGSDTVEHCISPEGGRAAISVISWVEFQLFLTRSDYPQTDTAKILGFYRDALGSPLPIDESVGKAAIALRAQTPTRIHLTDLLIAACAKEHGLKLVYRDKHIEGIPAKVLPQIKLPQKPP
ncbi:MAG: type II toxin-antitoxin system VapC family toxin [Terrimicrobiaceae bacterium]